MTLQDSKKATLLVALSAFVPNIFVIDNVLAQATANDTMNVSAKVVNPLQVTPSVNFKLNFQSFAIGGSGSFSVTPGGGKSIKSGISLAGATAGTAVLKVPQGVSFTLSIPTYKSASIPMTVSGGGASSKKMTVKSLYFQNVSKLSNATDTLRNGHNAIIGMKVTDPANTGKLAVGARIRFHPSQAVGTYHGTFVVRITL